MTTDAMIHVVFAPDGTVVNIAHTPTNVEPQKWFNFLTRNTTNAYEALSGGRGVFRLPNDDLGRLQNAYAA